MRGVTGAVGRRFLTCVTVAALAAIALPARAAASGRPVAPSRADLKTLEEIARWTAPPLDLAARLRDDAARAGKPGLPLRIGLPMQVDLGPASTGTWEPLGDGGQVWRLRVASADALWLVLGFDSFRLPDGARLFVYDPAQRNVLSYSSGDVREDGRLWSPVIEGSEIVLELSWPKELAGSMPDLHLGTVSHGYRPFGAIGRAARGKDESSKGIGDSGSCNIDVNCPLGADWQDQKRGVVILLSGGEGFCTGSLINTSANDCRPYVLTAAHCGAGSSTVFGFNFERSGCGTGNPPPPSTQQVVGATVRANYGSSDFTLLEMSSAAPEAFNAYYSGWNRSTAPATFTTVIHHPNGDVKMISRDTDPPIDGSNWGPNHWRIQQYEQGTTEPGSSGSPLFDQNKRIVGQLHGGTASCTSITYDEYGKLAVSWDGGGTTATRLSDWLDPNATGATTFDGVNDASCRFTAAGTLSLDNDRYACADTMVLTLRDDNLRGNPTQTVTVTSGAEPTPEVVTLTAVEPGSGFFTGSFPVGPGPAVDGDGTLSVGDGETIVATYIDADDGAGGINVPVTDTAAVDCAGPVIGNVASSNVTGNGATITWSTDELSNSVVVYDTAFPPAASTTTNAAVVVSHQVGLSGLTPCTTYFYFVRSTDVAGNTTTDTNNGAYYSFRTGANTNPTYPYTGAPVAIPDNNTVGATAAINVPYYDIISKVTVRVDITHTFDGDLSLSLIGPGGQTVPLSTRRGSSGDNFVATVFDDDAATAISAGSAPFTGSYRPESPLSVFDGTASYGDWTLKVVDGAGSDTGTITGWSITFEFPPAPCGAQVILGADTYSCTSTAAITVKDTNVAGATITVSAGSALDPAGETVVLTRQPAPKDTWFEGTVQLNSGPVVGGDGAVSVSNADTLTVSYLDADDGQGGTNVTVTDSSSIDCTLPVISGVFASNIGGSTATINWTTDEPSTSVVRYGPAIPPSLTQSNAAPVTTHALGLTGLTPCTTYYYAVESVDAFGNTRVDDNSGNYYVFATLQNTAATFASTDTPRAIPDNNTAGVTSVINVPDVDVISDLNVTLNLTHTFDGDLTISLIAPNGTSIALVTKRGSSGDNFTNTVLDDAAATAISAGSAPFTGSFRPESPLSVVNGLSAAGAWTLKVVDSASSDTGSIENWSLNFTYVPRACGPSAKYQSHTSSDSCPAGGTGGGNGSIERGENVVMPVTIRNDGTITLTGIVATLSAATPDVYVTVPTATFADVASGLSVASNAPHFQYAVGPLVPCGSDITFNLSIHTNQGTFGSAFTQRVGAPASATTDYVSTDVPRAIPDNSSTGVTSVVSVAETGAVQDVDVKVNITHTYDGDLTLTLIGPNGASVALSNRRGGSGDNFTDTVFDDQATTPIANGTAPFTGSFKPDGSLATLSGIPANGTWTLKAVDGAGSDTGTITGWTLTLRTGSGYTCSDCTPASPTVEPVAQSWVGKTGQTWEAIPGATHYRVYRGVAGDLPALLTPAVDSCLRLSPGTNATGAVLTESPVPGNVYWYLVRAANGGGEGPAGSATSGPRQVNSSGPCP